MIQSRFTRCGKPSDIIISVFCSPKPKNMYHPFSVSSLLWYVALPSSLTINLRKLVFYQEISWWVHLAHPSLWGRCLIGAKQGSNVLTWEEHRSLARASSMNKDEYCSRNVVSEVNEGGAMFGSSVWSSLSPYTFTPRVNVFQNRQEKKKWEHLIIYTYSISTYDPNVTLY